MKKIVVLFLMLSMCFCTISATAEEAPLPDDLPEQIQLVEEFSSEEIYSEFDAPEELLPETADEEMIVSEEVSSDIVPSQDPKALPVQEPTDSGLSEDTLPESISVPEEVIAEEDAPTLTEITYSEEETRDVDSLQAGMLSIGMVSEDVYKLQELLHSIGYYEYEPDGDFGPYTDSCVRKFQQDNGLYVDGIVGDITMGVLREKAGAVSSHAGNSDLYLGSQGQAVSELQKLLGVLGYYKYEPDGDFGPLTDSCVRKFQQDNSLYVDGIVGNITIGVLREKAGAASSHAGNSDLYLGSQGQAVSELQELLGVLGYYEYEPDGDFGPLTDSCVRKFQQDYGLYVDGLVGPITLNTLKEHAENVRNRLVQGMKGTAVKELQAMLYNLGYYPYIPDGDFGSYTDSCVRNFQNDYGLEVDGVAGPYTLNKLRSMTSPVLIHTITTQMSQGMTGDEVINLQNRLSALGYTLYPDGDYGALTVNAVRAFQLYNNLPVTGAVDSATIPVLNSSGAARYHTIYLGDDSSISVTAFQQILYDLGYLSLAPDGDFGYYTKNALKLFQLANGLVADGVLNNATVNKMVNSPVGYSSSLPLKSNNTITVENYGEDSGRMLIKWTEVPGADGYYLYRSSSENADYYIINITETACKYVDWGLDPDTTYYYFVMAYTGDPLNNPKNKQYIAMSNTASRKTPVFENYYTWTNTGISIYSGSTVYTDTATDAAANEIYNKLEAGTNFYLYIGQSDSSAAYSVFYGLKKKVSAMNECGVGFVSIDSYYSSGGYYYLIDAQTYTYVKKYVSMAYNERMEEYAIYLENNGSDAYFYDYHNETSYDLRYIAPYRDSLFETTYGTKFNNLSTESQLLFTTPGTNMVVRTDYMIFDLDYNTVGESAIDIIMKMSNKTAVGVCRHFALAVSTVCDYLDIPCWTPIDNGYNHQWAIVKTYNNSGNVVYYLVNNQNVIELKSEYDLKHVPVDDEYWDFTYATKQEMGSAYPF